MLVSGPSAPGNTIDGWGCKPSDYMQDNAARNIELEPFSNQMLVEYGRSILHEESAAVSSVAQNLSPAFAVAVRAIAGLAPTARLVVAGIGKTGCIGMKISATFASIGVPSFFLHPADAVHGDLGRVTPQDIALLLSNSGGTPELLQVVPGLRKLGVHIIALTSDAHSMLAKRSDTVLLLAKNPEAGPLGLAPTTSTTTMLALGDALAMTVLKLRPISREQFAVFHPGGNLGRTLMLVSDVMRRGDQLCIVDESLVTRTVLQKISETRGRPGAAAIIDATGRLSGVFTDGDLRRLLNKKADFLDLPISAVMTRTPKIVRTDVLAQEALKILSEYQIDQVIAIDDQHRPAGMVDIQDLVHWNTQEAQTDF